MNLVEQLTVKDLDIDIINEQTGSALTASHAPTSSETVTETPQTSSLFQHVNDVSPSTVRKSLSIRREIVLEAFGQTKACTDQFISEYKFGNYADYVLPRQTELCIAHIVEAFEMLGCSLRTAKQGQSLERIKYLPKHGMFVDLLYTMLEKEARLIDIDGVQITRTAIHHPLSLPIPCCRTSFTTSLIMPMTISLRI